MKILLSAYACEPNKGSEPGVGWNWALQLAKYNEVWVITRNNNRKTIESYLSENPLQNINFIFYDLPKWISFWKKGQKGVHFYYLLWQIAIYFIVKKYDKKLNFDLIHHLTFNEFRTPGFLFLLKKPFIWGPIGGAQQYDPRFKNIYGGLKIRFKERVRNLINCISKRSLIVNLALKKSKFILVADSTTYDFLPKKYRKKYIRLLETGININKNITRYNYEFVDSLNIIWVGNIIPRKGLPLLLNALNQVNEKVKYHLTIIGEGSDKERCLSISKELGIDQNIQFVGKIPYDKVQTFYKNANVFVFTSLRDTSGNVVLEAMNNNLPIICLDHHGVGDIVTDKCGIKIKVMSESQIVDDLAKAIEGFYFNRDLIALKGKESKKRLIEIYDWDKKGKIMNELYHKILIEGEIKNA